MSPQLNFLYREDLWFQIGELIEDLIILVRDCFFITNTKKFNIWSLFGKNLYLFLGKFSETQRELLPQISYIVLAIGVIRFQSLYEEEKLIFIENEIDVNKNIFKSNLALILLFQEIIMIYRTLSTNDLILATRMSKVLFKKIITSEKIKKFFLIIFKKNLTLRKDIYIEKKNFKEKAGKENHQINLFPKIFISKYNSNYDFNSLKYIDVFSSKFSKTKIRTPFLTLNQIFIFHHGKSRFFDLEKRQWYGNYIYKISVGEKIETIFLLNLKEKEYGSKEKSGKISSFYKRFFLNFFNFSYRKKIRWSKLSKKINGKSSFFEKLTNSIFISFQNKFILNQERQILSIFSTKAQEIFFNNKNPKNCSFYVQEILNKLSFLKRKILIEKQETTNQDLF